MNIIKESDGSKVNRHPVDILESSYPHMTEEFKRLQRIQYETFCRKQLDYGPGNISVGTELKTEEDLKDLQSEMVDRFGLLPESTRNLFRQASIALKVKNFSRFL